MAASVKAKKAQILSNTTASVPVPKRIVDQVLGQEKSVELIKKAAAQKRNVLLIGQPGTGKSMLAQAMAEILPVSELQDILVYPNAADPNNPKIVSVKAGEGKKILQQKRLEAQKEEDNMRLIGMLLPLGWFILAIVIWRLGWISDIIFAALIISGMFLMIGFILGTQMRTRETKQTPKLLIDNAGKKTAPFIEATGARAGALLGDVRHDPLQSIVESGFVVSRNGVDSKISFEQLWKEISEKHSALVETYADGYEAIVFPKEEEVFAYALNEKNEVVKSRIYSMNRRPYKDEVIEISAGESKITLTPEHRVVTKNGGKKAETLSKKDELIKLVKLESAKVFNQ